MKDEKTGTTIEDLEIAFAALVWAAGVPETCQHIFTEGEQLMNVAGSFSLLPSQISQSDI